MQDWYKDPQFITAVKTHISEKDALNALAQAYKIVVGSDPSKESLAILMAQFCLESARGQSCWCYNLGNIKKKHGSLETKITDDGQYFTMFRCGEIIKGKEEFFDPPHIQTHFVANRTILNGAIHYVAFLAKKKSYAGAWVQVLEGNPRAFVHALKLAGYFTASEERYAVGVMNIFNEFMRKIDKMLVAEYKFEHLPVLELANQSAKTTPAEVRIPADNLDLNEWLERIANNSREKQEHIESIELTTRTEETGFFALIAKFISFVLSLFGKNK